MRQLAAFEEKKEELEALGSTIYAVSVDSLDQAREVVGRGITFPVAYEATRSLSEKQCSKRYTSLVECKDTNYSTTKSSLL